MNRINLDWSLLDASGLTASDAQLLDSARHALSQAYAPYSKFRVGAALRLVDGTVVTGNNQENASFPNGLCAERVAMFAAASSFPDVAFDSLAIVTQSQTPVCPCGICRQTMLEYTNRFAKPFTLIVAGATDEVMFFEDAAELLPLGFTSRHLKT